MNLHSSLSIHFLRSLRALVYRRFPIHCVGCCVAAARYTFCIFWSSFQCTQKFFLTNLSLVHRENVHVHILMDPIAVHFCCWWPGDILFCFQWNAVLDIMNKFLYVLICHVQNVLISKRILWWLLANHYHCVITSPWLLLWFWYAAFTNFALLYKKLSYI